MAVRDRVVPNEERARVPPLHQDRTGRSDRYAVRRRSDGVILPVSFGATEVRPRR